VSPPDRNRVAGVRTVSSQCYNFNGFLASGQVGTPDRVVKVKTGYMIVNEIFNPQVKGCGMDVYHFMQLTGDT